MRAYRRRGLARANGALGHAGGAFHAGLVGFLRSFAGELVQAAGVRPEGELEDFAVHVHVAPVGFAGEVQHAAALGGGVVREPFAQDDQGGVQFVREVLAAHAGAAPFGAEVVVFAQLGVVDLPGAVLVEEGQQVVRATVGDVVLVGGHAAGLGEAAGVPGDEFEGDLRAGRLAALAFSGHVHERQAVAEVGRDAG
ncbi:hypothetical protein CTI14_02345 [Methylobacterium radiotolerans]|nr:hypothetical protein CTI14_02345 [Methylobacterium radiotolerans]